MEIIFTVSLGVATFFLKAMYSKFNETIDAFGRKLDEATRSIGKLNENVAVAVNNQTHLTKRLDKTENEIERLWKSDDEIKGIVNKLSHRLVDCQNEVSNLKE